MPRGNDSKWGPWWTAPALDTLTAELTKKWPKRTRPDGSIGDHKHTYPSDHLPDWEDMVCALDVSASGITVSTLINAAIRDPFKRTNYVIYQDKYYDRDLGFKPVKYLGEWHAHVHVSVYGGKLGRDARPWGLLAPAPAPAPSGPPPFLLPGGHVYGPITGPAWQHGGYYPAERPAVKRIQQQLIRRGCVPGVTNPASPWADGKYEAATTEAVRRFQRGRGGKVTDGLVGLTTWRALFS